MKQFTFNGNEMNVVSWYFQFRYGIINIMIVLSKEGTAWESI